MKRKVVEGRVVDGDGRPVAGAFVTIESESRHSDIASVTSREGRFRLELPNGDFELCAVTRSGKKAAVKVSKFNHNKFTPTISLL